MKEIVPKNNCITINRKKLGLTMKDVAKAVGVSEATVSRWESGKIVNMGRDKICALSKVLEISPTEITGNDSNSKASMLEISAKIKELKKQVIELEQLVSKMGNERTDENE